MLLGGFWFLLGAPQSLVKAQLHSQEPCGVSGELHQQASLCSTPKLMHCLAFPQQPAWTARSPHRGASGPVFTTNSHTVCTDGPLPHQPVL